MVRITERDVRLLATCAAARWLTTGQVQRLFFGDSTLDAVRKRLRKLSEAGFLQSRQSDRMSEMLHGIGRDGKEVLATKGIDVAVERGVPDHAEHCIGINDIRIAVSSASWRTRYFFAHWELGAFGWQYAVIPDAVFSIECPLRLTAMAEYDRGTEGRDLVLRKMQLYEGLLASFPFDAVLVVADSERSQARLTPRLAGPWRFGVATCRLSELIAAPSSRMLSEPGRSELASLVDLASE